MKISDKVNAGRVLDERDFKETWDIEFDEDDPPCPFEKLKLVEKSCDYATIGRTSTGRFLLWWHEALQPTRLQRKDYFIKLAEKAENERLWKPKLLHVQKISRREAFHILQWFWLPVEFQRDIKSTAALRLRMKDEK